MFPSINSNMIQEGLNRLTDFYRRLPNISGLTKSCLWSVQDLETAIWSVILAKNLNPTVPPTGDLLDRIAAIVGLLRNGVSDATLWTLVKVQVLVDNSKGRAEDLLGIANALSPGSRYFSHPIAAWLIVTLNTVTDTQGLRTALANAAAAGTRGNLKVSTWPLSETITCGSVYGYGFDQFQRPVAGFGSVYGDGSASVGGLVSEESASL